LPFFCVFPLFWPSSNKNCGKTLNSCFLSKKPWTHG
jgi:hypothetical protein